MKLKHAVITSVNRDDRKDGGAPIFAMVIKRIRELHPGCSIEVLVPDFKGSLEALKIVLDARPEILNHNVETVPRLFKKVQPQDSYAWTQATLSNAKELDAEVLTKSGIMLGLGETLDEVKAVMDDLRVMECRYPDHRPIPPAEQKTPAHRTLLHLRRVWRIKEIWLRDRFPVGRKRSAGAFFLPCRRTSARAERRTQQTIQFLIALALTKSVQT